MNHPIIMPYRGNLDMTAKAVADCLAQTIDVQLLLINNGGEDLQAAPPILYWHHNPPLPSLSATWNTALRWAWESGAEHALVVNNDVRLWGGTYNYLLYILDNSDALFVTATGVTEAQFWTFLAESIPPNYASPDYPLPGPDFSCFLITKECHDRYPFDEHYTPAFCEDLSAHREYMLGGDGHRVFGTGLPYLHYGSQTIKSLNPEKRERLSRQIEQGSRAYHLRKWGGGANQEKFIRPFGPDAYKGVTTADLFERVRNGLSALPDVLERDETYNATPSSLDVC